MSEPKKVGRRTFLNYAITAVATGVIVGTATYLATPKGGVGTVTAPGATTTVTAPGATTTVTAPGAGMKGITVAALAGGLTDMSTEIAKYYMNLNPGVKINVEGFPEATMNAETIARLPTAPPPDILYNSTLPSMNEKIVKPGYALCVDEYYEKYGWDKVNPTAERFKVDEHYYWIPFGYIYYGNIYYNKTMFEEKGFEVPKTMDELYKICDTLKKQDILPMVLGYQSQPEWFFNHFSVWVMNAMTPDEFKDLWTYYGPKLKTEEFKNRPIKLTDDIIVNQLKLVAEWRDKVFAPGLTSMTSENAVSLFASGKAAMLTWGCWIGYVWEASGKEEKFKLGWFPILAPTPRGALRPGRTQRMCLYALPFFIVKKTKYPDLCADFLNTFMTNPYVQSTFIVNKMGWLPGVPLAEALIENSHVASVIKAYATQFDYDYSLAAALAAELHDPFQAELGAILSGSSTPEESAKRLEEQAKRISGI